jgi:subtilisin
MALPRSGPLGWWHRAFGLTKYSEELGSGIRVGIIDTGIGTHPYLSHAKRAGAILNGKFDNAEHAADDVVEHGTHVAGIIGARPTDLKDYAGVAPGAELVALRVYSRSDSPGHETNPATNGDISQAIIRLARDEQCDIINLSSGGPLRSDIEIDRISAAFNAGTLMICAAGNGSGPPVQYPAAEPNVIGVSALGVHGGVPTAALDIFSSPATPDRYNGFGGFLAAFSSFGPEIKCIGPGVGIISTVPPRGERHPPYLAASGTSMAAPAIAGALAAILSRDPVYKSLPRNRERSLRAWKVLAQTLRSLGLGFPYQGFGLPTIPMP